MKRFQFFNALAQSSQFGKDYVIELRRGSSGIVVMAPHGGGIEPGTAFVADAIAGSEHGYYAFKGIRTSNNRQLHIPSICFDEPLAVEIIEHCHTVVTVHGCRGANKVVYVGGRDTHLKNHVAVSLNRSGFKAEIPSEMALRGEHRNNLCNRGLRGKGLQLEISASLRNLLTGNGRHLRRKSTPQLQSWARIVRQCLNEIPPPG